MIYISQPVYSYVYSLNSTIRKYRHDNLEKYIMATNKIIAENEASFLRNNVMEFVCTVFNVVCFNVVFTNQNRENYFQKRKIIRDLRKATSFKIAIDNVDMRALAFKHRMAIFFAKNNMYFCLCLMSMANQILNKLIY